MIYPLATALCALAFAALAYRSQGRTLNLYRVELAAAAEARAAQAARADGLAASLAAQVSLHREHAQAAEAREHALQADLRAAHDAFTRERRELLERIQRPHIEPQPDFGGEDVDRKLHYSEDDEIQGISPAQVAARAFAEEISPYIDEIAVREGIAT